MLCSVGGVSSDQAAVTVSHSSVDSITTTANKSAVSGNVVALGLCLVSCLLSRLYLSVDVMIVDEEELDIDEDSDNRRQHIDTSQSLSQAVTIPSETMDEEEEVDPKTTASLNVIQSLYNSRMSYYFIVSTLLKKLIPMERKVNQENDNEDDAGVIVASNESVDDKIVPLGADESRIDQDDNTGDAMHVISSPATVVHSDYYPIALLSLLRRILRIYDEGKVSLHSEYPLNDVVLDDHRLILQVLDGFDLTKEEFPYTENDVGDSSLPSVASFMSYKK